MAASIPSALGHGVSNFPSPSSTSVTTTSTWPKRSDFTPEQLEKIYWTKASWNNRAKTVSALNEPKGKKGRSRAAEGINVNMLYVVDVEGVAVTGHKATEIRRVARGIWADLLTRSLAPKHWSSATLRAGKCQFDYVLLIDDPAACS